MARAFIRMPVNINPTGRHECQTCSIRFDTTRVGGRPPRYCSDECERHRTLPCAACSEPVVKMSSHATGKRRPTCSNMCRYFLTFGRWQSQPWQPPVSQRRLNAERKIAKAAAGTRGWTWWAGECRVCGESFVFNQPNNAACSDRCAAKWSRDLRRARKRNAYVAPVYRVKIYERDHWTCRLCDKKLKRDAVVPHPLAPTIDHIIPLAVGGTHEPANVQAAHFLCNASKSAGGSGEQLALIG